MRGWKKDAIARRVQEMLDLLQLPGYGPRPVTQLSGGQRQRVALGRALAVDPRLLLLDEPMSNLDYKVRIELRHELRALQQRIGITAVYVTHDREEALTLADRIAVLDAGRVEQYGPPEEIFHRPDSPRSSRASWARTTRIALTRGWPTARSSAATRGRGEPLTAHFRSDAAARACPRADAGARDALVAARPRRAVAVRRPSLSLSRPHRRCGRVGPCARTHRGGRAGCRRPFRATRCCCSRAPHLRQP